MTTLTDTLHEMLRPGRGVVVLDQYAETLLERHSQGNDVADTFTRAVLASDAVGRSVSGVLMTARRLAGLPQPWPDAWHRAHLGVRIDDLSDGVAPEPAIDAAARKGATFVEIRANRRPGHVRPGETHVPVTPMLRAARAAQARDLLPVLSVAMPGLYSASLPVTRAVIANSLTGLYSRAHEHGLDVSRTVLRVAPIAPGYRSPRQPWPAQVARATLDTLDEAVPASVPAVWFLSAGHSLAVASDHLRAISGLAEQRSAPWAIGFAAGRALVGNALTAWPHGGADAAAQKLGRACDSLGGAVRPALARPVTG